MKANKKAGIWMDYSVAYVTELKNHILETTIVNSAYADPWNGMATDRAGGLEKQLHVLYYTKLGDMISRCDEVILYGPADAKWELLQFLRANYLFANIKISTKSAAEMSREEQHVFFSEYFMKIPETEKKDNM